MFEVLQEDPILLEIRDRYRRELVINIGEVDRDQAEAVVRRMYEFAGLVPPKLFLWVEQPEDAVVAAILICRQRFSERGLINFVDIAPDFLVGPLIRRSLIHSKGPVVEDDELQMRARWFRSLDDASLVFRRKLGGRGLLQLRPNEPFAIDSWLESFLDLEWQFEFQSAEFAGRWKQAASAVWSLTEREHRDELMRFDKFGRRVLGEPGIWERRDPYLLVGSMEAFYGALAELNYHAVNGVSGSRGSADSGMTRDGVELMLEYIRHCGWCCAFDDVCILAERPEILFELKDIRAEGNVEARRLMIEFYGLGKYLQESGAVLIHQDQVGELYRMRQVDDEDLVVVKVVNSTAEPDGSFREYFLRVPPSITHAREAVAWSFGMKENEYEPKVQT